MREKGTVDSSKTKTPEDDYERENDVGLDEDDPEMVTCGRGDEVDQEDWEEEEEEGGGAEPEEMILEIPSSIGEKECIERGVERLMKLEIKL
jgi:hypothetical protein